MCPVTFFNLPSISRIIAPDKNIQNCLSRDAMKRMDVFFKILLLLSIFFCTDYMFMRQCGNNILQTEIITCSVGDMNSSNYLLLFNLKLHGTPKGFDIDVSKSNKFITAIFQ